MAASSSIKLLNTSEWAKKFNFGRTNANNDFLEPALTSANTVAQTILGAPFSWRWNRVLSGFVTVAGQQDYTLFNYTATTLVKLGWNTIDDAGNAQVCTTPGTTGGGAPTWSHTLGGVTTDGSVVWTNLGPILPTAQGSYTFAWMETQSVKDPIKGWVELNSKISLGLDSTQGRPTFISAQSDDGLGNVTFRLMSCPDQAYPIAVTMQQKPPIFTKLSQTWAPIPDEYSHIYNWGFLSLMWLFADDPRFATANQKFIAALLGTAEGLTETEKNIFLNTWFSITGQPNANMQRQGQGFQSRQT
jgi:hypothetical protein